MPGDQLGYLKTELMHSQCIVRAFRPMFAMDLCPTCYLTEPCEHTPDRKTQWQP